MEARRLTPASTRRKLAAVSSLFNYLCEEIRLPTTPPLGCRAPSEGANEGKTPALSEDQARALLKLPSTWQGKRDRAMLAVLLYHGLRASELCSLKVGDYPDRRSLRMLTVRGKGSKIRYEPAHPKAVAAITFIWRKVSMSAANQRRSLSPPLIDPPGPPRCFISASGNW